MVDMLSLKQLLESKINGEFQLPKLPYKENALEPYISEETIHFHYHKHHAGYVKKLNELVKGSKYERMPLVDVIKLTDMNQPHIKDETEIFNNAAQDWNHTFYWNSMKPDGGGQPSKILLNKINDDFGSVKDFKEEFVKVGKSQFGSGWVWLTLYEDKLQIWKSSDADLPMIHHRKALFCCDVWEHSYYLQYKNDREKYLKNFVNHLINWDFAEKNFI